MSKPGDRKTGARLYSTATQPLLNRSSSAGFVAVRLRWVGWET
jgi:hypothetical protein